MAKKGPIELLEELALDHVKHDYFSTDDAKLFKKVFRALNKAVEILPQDEKRAVELFLREYSKIAVTDEIRLRTADYYEEKGMKKDAEYWKNQAILEDVFDATMDVLSEYKQLVNNPYEKFGAGKKLFFRIDELPERKIITNVGPNAYDYKDEAESLLMLLDLDVTLGKVGARKYAAVYDPEKQEYSLVGVIKNKNDSVFLGRIKGKDVRYAPEEIQLVTNFVNAALRIYERTKEEIKK
ncbi:MAG: hypothetical protein J7K73_00950 [Nanoarchaeota archaeon]|nr:hypothetical protein [Nanoarchaeota archaeon]